MLVGTVCAVLNSVSILNTNTRPSRKGGVKQRWQPNAWVCPDNAGLGVCLSFTGYTILPRELTLLLLIR